MRSIDWTALGTWVGSISVLIGVVVALIQLRSINQNEVTKTTVEYLGQFTAGEIAALDGIRQTPAVAISYLLGALVSPKAIVGWRNTIPLFRDPVTRGTMNEQVRRDAAEVITAATVASNYFVIAESLARRHRLDKDLFFDTLSGQLKTVWRFAEAYQGVEHAATNVFNQPQMRTFANEAAAWETDHPNLSGT
jgi:hypothetical protein